jgi:pyridoxamine-phosphate oxidase
MIEFLNLSKETPYVIFRQLYDEAISANQKSIEAISIASSNHNDIDSRFVNLKIIKDKDFIFFSNYKSLKSRHFNSNNNIAALIYWSEINTQIRIKATIKKTSNLFSDEYFKKRSPHKNALAISSNQSQVIDSYNLVESRYKKTLKNEDLTKRPSYWGGYMFKPYYFEFWEGHESRINKREVFDKINGSWKQSYLQP